MIIMSTIKLFDMRLNAAHKIWGWNMVFISRPIKISSTWTEMKYSYSIGILVGHHQPFTRRVKLKMSWCCPSCMLPYRFLWSYNFNYSNKNLILSYKILILLIIIGPFTWRRPEYFSTDKTQMLLCPRLETKTNLPVLWTVILPQVFKEFGYPVGIVLMVWINSKHCSGGEWSDPSTSRIIKKYTMFC